jgi:putative phage-type endonuclease
MGALEKLKAEPLVTKVSENREAFVEARKGKIGSSDIAAICGIDPYRTRMDVWAEMTGRLPKREDNDTLWLGRQLEKTVADLFTRRTGTPLENPDTLYQSNLVDWAVISPDRVFEHTRSLQVSIVECKAPRVYQKSKWGPDKAPDSAHLQLMWQMGHLGVEHGYCVGLLGGNTEDFYMPYFRYDEVCFAQAMTMAEDFMRLVQTDTPPAATSDDKELLDLLFSKPNETMIELADEPEIAFLFGSWEGSKILEADLGLKLKNAERERRQVEAKLSLLLANNKAGRWRDYTILRQNWKRSGFTVEPKEGVRFVVKRQKKWEEENAD